MKRSIKDHEQIKDSLNQSFIFHKDEENNLMFKKLNENDNNSNGRIVENNVVDFSTSIDKNDIIHLIYLTRNGELTYGIYVNEEWQRNLVKTVDIKSNIYRYLNLFLHENHVNIFYSFTNIINTNLWTIEHIIKDSDQWRKLTVTNIFCEGNFDSFYVDKDKFGNLFIVYMAREYNTNHIYYNTYNTFINKWGKSLIKISHSETDNIYPYLFIDSRDNIHVLWLSLKNNDYLIYYKQLSSIGKRKYHWEEIKLPKMICSKYPPIMYEEGKELKILCIIDDMIQYLVSKNYGINWSLENKVPIDKSEVQLIKYAQNNSDNNIDKKINHYYGDIDEDKVSISALEKNQEPEPEPEPDPEHEQEQESTEKEELIFLEKVLNTMDYIRDDIELLNKRIQKIEEKQNKRWFFK